MDQRPEIAELDYIQLTPAEATPLPGRTELEYFTAGPEVQSLTVYETTATVPSEETTTVVTTTSVEMVTELTKQEMPAFIEEVRLPCTVILIRSEQRTRFLFEMVHVSGLIRWKSAPLRFIPEISD